MKVRKDRLNKSKRYRKELIDNQTPYEIAFKPFLKKYKYNFQKVFFTNEYQFFIVDFYIPTYRLVVELDGRQHDTNQIYDSMRTKKLKELGVLKVLRFKNTDLINKENVKQHLKLALYECKRRITRKTK